MGLEEPILEALREEGLEGKARCRGVLSMQLRSCKLGAMKMCRKSQSELGQSHAASEAFLFSSWKMGVLLRAYK